MPRSNRKTDKQEASSWRGAGVRIITAAVPSLAESTASSSHHLLRLPDLVSAEWAHGKEAAAPLFITRATQLGTLRRALDAISSSPVKHMLSVVELGGLLGAASNLLQPQVS